MGSPGPARISPGRRVVPCAASATTAVQSNADGSIRATSEPSARTTMVVADGSSSSGVATTGPSTSAKSRSFGGVPPSRRHSAKRLKPAIAPSAPITAASRGTSRRIPPFAATSSPGPPIAVALANAKSSSASKTRTVGGTWTGTRSVTSARAYSPCSRALPPPRKSDCSVWAARCSTRSPSTRPTQPRSMGLSFGWNMHRRIDCY